MNSARCCAGGRRRHRRGPRRRSRSKNKTPAVGGTGLFLLLMAVSRLCGRRARGAIPGAAAGAGTPTHAVGCASAGDDVPTTAFLLQPGVTLHLRVERAILDQGCRCRGSGHALSLLVRFKKKSNCFACPPRQRQVCEHCCGRGQATHAWRCDTVWRARAVGHSGQGGTPHAAPLGIGPRAEGRDRKERCAGRSRTSDT